MRPTWKEVLGFTVIGKPAAQGSLTSFMSKTTGAVITPQKKNVLEWRGIITAHAANAMGDMPIITEPVKLTLTFMFTRPKAHYGSGRNHNVLKSGAPIDHAQKPDLDKLVRAVKDALSGIVYKDDSQVCNLGGTKKLWVGQDVRPGVLISVQTRQERELMND